MLRTAVARSLVASLLAPIALILVAAGAVTACGGESKVVRVYDGRIVEGKFISPDAYAWFLRGVLAEDSGDLDAAINAYEQAVKEDDDDAEVWARLGGARCKKNPKDGAVDKAFANALSVDRTYAGALAAKARCELGRGNAGLAAIEAQKAAHEDPANVEIEALLVRAEAKADQTRGPAEPRASASASSGDRAIALTLAYAERPAAWEALIAWGDSKNRADLVARGLEGLLRAAPARSPEVEKGAAGLLGDGHTGLARRVAAAIADAPPELLVRGPRDATVARLAVDEALARGDEGAATARATRGRVELAEVAARAVILERRDIAMRVAKVVALADPSSSAAHMVLAALATGSSKASPALARIGDDAPPEICALVLADRLAEAAGVDTARAWLAKVPRRAMAPHDPLGGPLAVDLAARGVLGPTELGPELRIELAARRREAPPPIEKNGSAAEITVDTKHAFLLAALTEPTGAIARALVSRFAGSDDDPLVAFAIARITLGALAPGANPERSRLGSALDHVRRAAAATPADPLVLSALVELARIGPETDLAAVRSRLMAVARTPAERALAAE